MRVQIYQDYVHNHGALLCALNEHFGEGAVVFRDAGDITAGCLGDADLLVMPGGADLYYCEKLNGGGNAAIRAFVEQGGAYLGICAGAYYGCAIVDWAAGKPQEIIGERELGFYPGTAQGPIYALLQGGDIEQSWQNIATVHYADGKTDLQADVHYMAGPVFRPASSQAENIIVLARYDTLPGRPAAILECAVGAGKAILCSPHLETRSDATRRTYIHRNASHAWEKDVAQRLAETAQGAETIWQAVLSRCAA